MSSQPVVADATFPLAEVRGFVLRVLDALGLPAHDAAVVAARMLEADVRGMRGHGIFRLPAYAERVRAGGYNLTPQVRTLHETPVSALVDGDNGFGQVVMTRAMQLAIAKAKDQGLAWIGTRASNHAGAAGVYAAMALEHDLIGIYLAVGNANHLAPWGGVEPLMSTNPLAVALPAREQPPIVLDMATTVVSYGRVKIAAQTGEPLPEGWMVDRTGAPLTDPARVAEGLLLPIGGYKGYGLGLVIGCLAGVVNGAALGSDVVDFSTDHTTPTNTGQTVVVVRPDLFRPLDEVLADMDARIRELRESTPLDGHPPVRTPGDQAAERAARVEAHGLVVEPVTAATLGALARDLGVEDGPFVEAAS